MFKKIKLWTDHGKDIREELRPDLSLRDWDILDSDEKEKAWHYLKGFFEGGGNANRVYTTIYVLNDSHKYNSYGKNFLHEANEDNAFLDIKDIFFNQSQNVLFQTLSFYSRIIVNEKEDTNVYRHTDTSDEEYEKERTDVIFKLFDGFSLVLNDVFEQFGVNVVLMRTGFVPRQEKKITDDIYRPVLGYLSSSKWSDVNRELKDAFESYQLKTSIGYSKSITHAISSVEAYLQVIIYGKIGKGVLKTLINDATTKSLIPSDKFSVDIINKLESILAKERKVSGDAHPKKEYANEKNARLVMNLVMVLLQHFIQSE